MLADFLEAASIIFSWPIMLYVIFGVLIGMIFAAIPGLGGLLAMALLLPFTVMLDAVTTMALFGAILGGIAFGGSTSAILLNVPGTAPNAATCLDGYPMARQGRGAEALAISATASCMGAIFGLIIILLSIPIIQQVLLRFAAPEFFVMAMAGIVVVAFVTEGEFIKGLISGGIGLMISFVGFDPITSTIRFNVIDMIGISTGANYLYDGITLIPLIIGLFAIAEALNLMVSKRSTISETHASTDGEQIIKGIKRVFQHPIIFIRSSVIGVVVGMIPGVGGTAANFFSYMNAVQFADDNTRFGDGDPRGVIAAESANDSKDGGALLPTLAFGIPGSAPMALILGALTLHGIPPGPEVIRTELVVVFTLIIALLIANILTSLIGLSMIKVLVKITAVNINYIVPTIVVVSLLAAYSLNESLIDVTVALIFGIISFFMIKQGYSRIALIIGFLLGTIAEVNFYQAINAYDGGIWIFFARPISAFLMLLVVLMIIYPRLRRVTQSL